MTDIVGVLRRAAARLDEVVEDVCGPGWEHRQQQLRADAKALRDHADEIEEAFESDGPFILLDPSVTAEIREALNE